MTTAREQRIQDLKAKIGTVHETELTAVRIAEYEAMTDAQYNERMAGGVSRTAARLAADALARR